MKQDFGGRLADRFARIQGPWLNRAIILLVLLTMVTVFIISGHIYTEHLMRLQVGNALNNFLSLFLIVSFVIVFLAVFILVTVLVQKRTQARLTQVMRAVEQSPATIMITDSRGNIEYVNPKFTQLTGYTSKEVLGKNPRILKSGRHLPEFYKDLWDTIRSGREWRGEFQDKKKNGEVFWESASISPVKDHHGQVTHFIAVKEDISERKRLEEEVRKAVAVKAEFTSMVSHELRTPLGPIKEGAGIILDGLVGGINPEQRELLIIVKNNADRLHRLIDNVLDFQKMESGNIPFDLREEGICEVIKEVADALVLVARHKKLELSVECGVDIPRIRFDRDKIVQVLINLVSNAIKFTDQGAVRIKVGKDGDAVHVVVEDTGPGMREGDLPRLFESFQQLKNMNDRKTGGTGLGLAISKEIILRHQGKIWVESELGKGSAFHFVLPAEECRTKM